MPLREWEEVLKLKSGHKVKAIVSFIMGKIDC